MKSKSFIEIINELVFVSDLYLEYIETGYMPDATIQHIISSGDYLHKIINTMRARLTSSYKTSNKRKRNKGDFDCNLNKLKDMCEWINEYPELLQLYICVRIKKKKYNYHDYTVFSNIMSIRFQNRTDLWGNTDCKNNTFVKRLQTVIIQPEKIEATKSVDNADDRRTDEQKKNKGLWVYNNDCSEICMSIFNDEYEEDDD